MTENKSSRPNEPSFNLVALEKMDSKKTRGARSFKLSNYQMERSAAKPVKKFDPLKQSNPWAGEVAYKSEKKPYVIRKPDAIKRPGSQSAGLKKESPAKKTGDSASVTADATATMRDTAPPENYSAPAPASKNNTASSKKDDKSRIFESVIEQAGADKAKGKVSKGSGFTDKTVKKIVIDKAAKKSGKKTLRVEVAPLGSVIAGAISKGIDAASERIKRRSLLSDSAQRATAIAEKVADGALATGLGVGRIAGYVVRGALDAPVDIASGVGGLIGNTTSKIARFYAESKKKSGGRD